MQVLLKGSPHVVGLVAANPFLDRPPKYVRALLYDYRFADPGTYARTGQWWVRRLEGLYFPQVTLADFSQAVPRSDRQNNRAVAGGMASLSRSKRPRISRWASSNDIAGSWRTGKLGVLRIECPKCGRLGKYRLAVLIAKYGRDEKRRDWESVGYSM